MIRQIRNLISGGLAPVPCRRYEARLEDYLQRPDDTEMSEHLRRCAGCRAALEDSRLGGELLRVAWEPRSEPNIPAGSPSELRVNKRSPHPDSAFLAGVMARIREEKMRTESPAAFWNPLEFLASRLSLTAAALLLALSVYMVGFAPRHAPTLPASARTELRAADFPQPPGDPDSNEEVFQSLVETDNGN